MKKDILTSLTLKRETFIVILATLFLFLNTTFYFFDPIYIPRFVTFSFSVIILFVIINPISLKFRFIIIVILLFSIIGQIGAFLNAILNASMYSIAELVYTYGLIQIIFLLTILSLNKSTVLRIANYYIDIIIILTIPGLLLQILILVNVNIDYQLINLGGRDLLSRNYYYIAIFNDYEVLQFGNFTFARMCGMFEEAGMLGTIIGVLLATDLIAFPEKKGRKLLLIIIGLMTLSLTFYILLGFYILFYIGKYYQKPLTLVTSAVSVICLSIFFMAAAPADIKDAFDSLIISRLVISDSGLAGDSGRVSYAERYSEYYSRASLRQLVFGNGAKSNLKDPEANYGDYRSIVYENGYLGLLLIIIFGSYFTIYLPLINNKFALALMSGSTLIVFYHRVDILLPHFLMIYSVVFFIAQTSTENQQRPVRA